jgi:hypothetical protein
MSDRNDPTPIPLRASRKPEPIVLRQPRPLVSPAMRDYIHQEITKALYAIGHYDPEPNIGEMSYEAFEAFMMQVWEEE